MPRQILIHAGFHKTGTSSVQATLRANGPQIWPTHALVLPHRIHDATRMATMHSVMGGPVSLAEFKDRLLALFKGLTLGRRRGLIVSAEDLAGLIPGRRGHVTYDACPDLMVMIESCLRQVWGSDTSITFYFGTREPEGWYKSLYWQNLRSSRLTMEFQTFADSLGALAFDEVIKATKAKLRHATVRTIRLEDQTEAEFGPATPILEAANLLPEHRARLVPGRIANASPSNDILRAVLAMNRSDASDEEVAQGKDRLLRGNGAVPKPIKIA